MMLVKILPRALRWRVLRARWLRINPGMTIPQVEKIMGMSFALDSSNAAGRDVYSNHEVDRLPFYVVVDHQTGQVLRKHDIRVLDEL